MPWYTWVFSGVGAAAVVPFIGWVLARLHRPQASTAMPAGSRGTPASLAPAAAALPATATPSATTPVDRGNTGQPSLIEFLVAIPEMQDPGFRRLAYTPLPASVAQQLQMGGPARIELLSLIDTFGHYPQLRPWQALQDRMRELLPDNPAVERLAAELARLGLIGKN